MRCGPGQGLGRLPQVEWAAAQRRLPKGRPIRENADGRFSHPCLHSSVESRPINRPDMIPSPLSTSRGTVSALWAPFLGNAHPFFLVTPRIALRIPKGRRGPVRPTPLDSSLHGNGGLPHFACEKANSKPWSDFGLDSRCRGNDSLFSSRARAGSRLIVPPNSGLRRFRVVPPVNFAMASRPEWSSLGSEMRAKGL